MNATIPSKYGYPGEYMTAGENQITRPSTGKTYEKQLTHGGYAWYSDPDDFDESSNTVMCEIDDAGTMAWVADSFLASISLVDELHEIKTTGAIPEYISENARDCMEEMEA